MFASTSMKMMPGGFEPEAPAVASIRGNPQFKTDLAFEYVEAYVVPKRSLTGDSTERVDTRVMQVVYSFKRGMLPFIRDSSWTYMSMTGRLALTNPFLRPTGEARNEKKRAHSRKNECLEMNLRKSEIGNSDRRQGT